MEHQGKIEDISVHKIDNFQTGEGKDSRPDPEVLEKKPRRHFTYENAGHISAGMAEEIWY